MARSDIHFARGAPMPGPLKTKNKEMGPLLHTEEDADAILHQKMPRAMAPWTLPQHGSQRSSRSSSRLTGSKDSLNSTALTGSGASPPEGKRRLSMSSGGATPDPSSTDQTWISDSHQGFSLSVLDYSKSSPDAFYPPPQKIRSSKSKVHIKPLLRKMSRDDTSTSIDLSRSTIEQEGLGIYTSFERDKRQGDCLANTTTGRPTSGFHHRSTSGASQFSVTSTSSMSKPGSQYVHPMRRTPRPYTPPLSQSYQNSTVGSEDSTDMDQQPPDTDFPGHSSSDVAHESATGTGTGTGTGTPGQVPRLSLHIRDSSFGKLAESSPTNFIARRSFGHARESSSALETISPLSRSSLDFSFRSRTRTNTDTDPVSRAATVQAARQAFEEKEAAKTRKYERQKMKAQEKELRRREKRQWQRYRDVDHLARATGSDEDVSEKSSGADGVDYGSVTGGTSGDDQRPQTTSPLTGQTKPDSWKSSTRNTWMLFLTWLRTRVFKVSRRLRRPR